MTNGGSYPPGSKALLVYQDQHGHNCSSIVELVDLDQLSIGRDWRAIKARKEIFNQVFNIPPIKINKIDVEDGWAISFVSEERLAPLGTRIFRIVQ